MMYKQNLLDSSSNIVIVPLKLEREDPEHQTCQEGNEIYLVQEPW